MAGRILAAVIWGGAWLAFWCLVVPAFFIFRKAFR